MKIPFDQYQRYKNASELINVVRENNQKFSILEVGANEHRNLEKFLPFDNITYLDIVVPEHLKNDPSYIQGDATKMPLDDDRFDFIIALDVFEHIPQQRRSRFLNELDRVSKRGFILAAPFNTVGVAIAEERVNSYFKTLYGYNYPWLEEHLENKLPEIEEVIQHFNLKSWNYYNFSHGSLSTWEKLTGMHFLAAGREVLYDYRFMIDKYYNQELFNFDYLDDCYRNFFIVMKSGQEQNLEQIEKYILSKKKTKVDTNVYRQLDILIDSFLELSNFQMISVELGYKNHEIENLKKELERSESKLDQVKTVNNEMSQEIERLEIQKSELNKKLNECNLLNKNLDLLLQQKDREISEQEEKHLEYSNNIMSLDNKIKEQENLIAELELISQQMRLKNRLKKLIPIKLKSRLRKGLSIFQLLKKNPELMKKGLIEVKKNGYRSARNKINSKMSSTAATVNYDTRENTINLDEINDEINKFTWQPLISIIMPVYNVDPKWLELAIQSVRNQVYRSWELCIVDDCSTNEHTKSYLKSLSDPKIKIKMLEKNTGISEATNEAVSLSTGDYITLLDNDDEITIDALFEVVKAINKTGADMLYSDEDKIDIHGHRKYPFHKPDWSPDLLRSQMYIGHLLVFKKELFQAVGGFRKEFDGSQDYDLTLRMSEIAKCIYHIPKVLYSWRELESSTALNPYSKPYAHHAGLKALDEHLKRVFGFGNAYAEESEYLFVYNSRFMVRGEKASIIIPTKDKIELLDPCVSSILEKTEYDNYEIIIINNNSTEKETFEWFNKYESHPKIKIINANYEFNWSKLNNHGIREATGDVFVFLNNDTRIINGDWLLKLLENALRPDIGTVGALLMYEDNTIQHAGVVIGLGGWADHVFKGMELNHYGSPYISPMLTRNVIASTGACLAISRDTINEIGPFDEGFIICGSDVEISLRAIKHGKFNLYDPNVRLYHLESKSRDSYIPEIDFELSHLHYSPYLVNGDPFYNINLDLNSPKPMLVKGKENN